MTCQGCYMNPNYSWYSPNDIPSYTYPQISITKEEIEICRYLVLAWNTFTQLDSKNPSDNEEFLRAIHDAQKMIALRVARRANPEIWNTTE